MYLNKKKKLSPNNFLAFWGKRKKKKRKKEKNKRKKEKRKRKRKGKRASGAATALFFRIFSGFYVNLFNCKYHTKMVLIFTKLPK